MNCPSCNVPLVMSERHRVEIDHCPRCRGVWLDRGELDKILEQTTPPRYDVGVRSGDDDDRWDDDKGFRKRKRGGLLGELFDF